MLGAWPAQNRKKARFATGFASGEWPTSINSSAISHVRLPSESAARNGGLPERELKSGLSPAWNPHRIALTAWPEAPCLGPWKAKILCEKQRPWQGSDPVARCFPAAWFRVRSDFPGHGFWLHRKE